MTARLRSSCQKAETLTRANGTRYVDLGVEIRVVKQDGKGTAFLRGKPKLAPIRKIRIGGLWDTIERKYTGESKCPIVWYAGEKQADLLEKIWNEPTCALRWMLISAEGGGKTVTMSQALWVFILALSRIGLFGAIGATAPTHTRLDTFVQNVSKQAPIDSPREPKPDSWATFFSAEKELICCTGHQVQFRATKKASAATGSPVQGFTWLGSFDDELQDSVENGADPDIEARLREAESSLRVATVTTKDSPQWRAFRDAKEHISDWVIERIRYNENPFVWPAHWARMQRNMSKREWQRRGLAMDVGPERATYHAWDHDKNLRSIPRIGAKDITTRVLNGFSALVAHDPGSLVDVSLLLKCYEIEKRRNWWVIDEITTTETTSEQHAQSLRNRLQQNWQLQWPDADEPKVLVRCDPYGDSDSKTDKSVYTAFRIAGFHILSAAYNKKGEGRGRVPKDPGIEMVNRLFCSASEERRLFIDCDEQMQPVAPMLVKAIETDKRNEMGEAEVYRKGELTDLSHYLASLRYGLWPYERLRELPQDPREALV